MSKVAHFLADEMTFLRLQSQICLPQPIKNLLQVLEMLLKSRGYNKYVIYVNETFSPLKTSQHHLHCSLKRGRCITEAEGDPNELKESLVGGKSGFWPGIIIKRNLPVPEAKSRVVKYLAFPNMSKMSSTLGRGYTSLLVIAFNFLKSTQSARIHLFWLQEPLG